VAIVGDVSARRRMVLLVSLVAAAAAGIAAVAVVSAGGGSHGSAAEAPKLRPGRPPLSLALGFRTDAEARDLRRAEALYAAGRLAPAEALFARHHSLEAQVGAAFASWPHTTLDRLEQLSVLYPQSALVQLHLGLARLWANQGDPVAAWRAAVDAEPDTPYAILAGNVLHPRLPRGIPIFTPSFSAPRSVTRLPPGRQLEALRRLAAREGARGLLLYGVGLQRVGEPTSAERAFERAARIAPNDAEARVAAAVGSFDKDQPAVAFGRLGPLTRTFPNEPSVRFHLGLLLVWTGRIDAAERQFRIASRTRPGSVLAREAGRYLAAIRGARSR
jgi:tetratricopeptide (TPR) repeat protein